VVAAHPLVKRSPQLLIQGSRGCELCTCGVAPRWLVIGRRVLRHENGVSKSWRANPFARLVERPEFSTCWTVQTFLFCRFNSLSCLRVVAPGTFVIKSSRFPCAREISSHRRIDSPRCEALTSNPHFFARGVLAKSNRQSL